MTKELIAIPFQPASPGAGQDHVTQGKESWTAQTRVYQTKLACTPSEINISQGTEYAFTRDKCKYTINPIFNPNGTQTMLYIGFPKNNRSAPYFSVEGRVQGPELVSRYLGQISQCS